MLMDAYRSAVDHLHITVVGLANGGHDAVPNPRLAPAHEAVVAGRVGAEILRQGPPWRARPQHPKDAIQHSPVINPRHAARLIRQQRRDHSPLEIAQLVSLHDPTPTVGKLESHLDSRGNPFYEFMT